MDVVIETLLTLLGLSWLLLNFAMKFRTEIDQLRDRIVFQTDKDKAVHDTQLRLYLLRKDLGERCAVLCLILLLYAAVMLFIGVTMARSTFDGSEASGLLWALIVLFHVAGIGGLAGGAVVAIFGKQDYKNWQTYIRSGELPTPSD